MTRSTGSPDVLVDTSAAVPLMVSGHDAHQSTLDGLDGRRLGLAGHAWFETFSVLTRLPPPVRRSPRDVTAALQHNFPESRFLREHDAADLAARLADIPVAGGAVYDALVGYAAAVHAVPLATRDRRALDVYRSVGATTELLP